MDYVSALNALIPVVKSLQESGQDVISVTASKVGAESQFVHIFEPVNRDFFRGRTATVKRVQNRNEWSLDIDGVRVFWLQAIEGEPEVRTVTL